MDVKGVAVTVSISSSPNVAAANGATTATSSGYEEHRIALQSVTISAASTVYIVLEWSGGTIGLPVAASGTTVTHFVGAVQSNTLPWSYSFECDTTRPTIQACVPDQVVSTSPAGACSAQVTISGAPTLSDDYDSSLDTVCDPPATYAKGFYPNAATCTFTDDEGNSGTSLSRSLYDAIA
jgi:hypothetical protein